MADRARDIALGVLATAVIAAVLGAAAVGLACELARRAVVRG